MNATLTVYDFVLGFESEPTGRDIENILAFCKENSAVATTFGEAGIVLRRWSATTVAPMDEWQVFIQKPMESDEAAHEFNEKCKVLNASMTSPRRAVQI